MGRKPFAVNRPGFFRPADLSKRRELFTNYTLQTARRLEYFASSHSDLQAVAFNCVQCSYCSMGCGDLKVLTLNKGVARFVVGTVQKRRDT